MFLEKLANLKLCEKLKNARKRSIFTIHFCDSFFYFQRFNFDQILTRTIHESIPIHFILTKGIDSVPIPKFSTRPTTTMYCRVQRSVHPTTFEDL